MERTVQLDGREVRLRASAAIPRLYRIKFRRDIMQDMVAIQRAVERAEKGEASIPMECLELFENVSYLMAKHADPQTPGTVEEWLDGFETFSIYAVFPVVAELWEENMKTLSVPAKK